MARKKGKKKGGHHKKRHHGIHGTSDTTNTAISIVASATGQMGAAFLLNMGNKVIPQSLPEIVFKLSPLTIPGGVIVFHKALPKSGFIQQAAISAAGYGFKSTVGNFIPALNGIMDTELVDIEKEVKKKLGSMTVGAIQEVLEQKLNPDGNIRNINGEEDMTVGHMQNNEYNGTGTYE